MHRARTSILLFYTASVITAIPAANSRSVWDGVYTKPQSSRGQARYREECAKCHAENLMGGKRPPLWLEMSSFRNGPARLPAIFSN